jgi:hypothetical protein
VKYLRKFNNEGWDYDYDSYFDNLNKNKNDFPQAIYSFAANRENYGSLSHESLHDAWLEVCSVTEVATGLRSEKRNLRIDMSFLGAYHDLKILLSYEGVKSYVFHKNETHTLPPLVDVGHGDLLVHEFSVDNEESVVHEMLFSSGSNFKIVFGNLMWRIVKF